uniref:Uncharacterized protein n=1 Tax=Arundo donax TaxID=35708 RepID=A0A0A9FSL1_ARUDO
MKNQSLVTTLSNLITILSNCVYKMTQIILLHDQSNVVTILK